MSAELLTGELSQLKVVQLTEPLTVKQEKGSDKLSLLKRRAAHIRWKGINFSDKYLMEFESNFSRRGGKVHWAFNEKELAEELKLLACKQKIRINASLYNTVNPALFLNISKNETIKQAWLINAGYLIADPGGVSFNLPYEFRLPEGDDLILITTVDKVLPSLANLETMIHLKDELKQQDSSSVQLLFGRSDSGGEVHLFITENKASEMMAVKSHRSLLHCINCNQCFMCLSETTMVDEMKKQVLDRSGEILTDSFSFPLDGKHSAVCPVKINFEKLLLVNRQSAVNRNYVPSSEKWFYFFWTKAVVRKNKIPVPGRSLDYYVTAIFNKSESKLRQPLQPARKPFSKLWKEISGLN